MYAIMGVLSILGFFISLIILIISLFRRSGIKRSIFSILICFLVFIVCIYVTPTKEDVENEPPKDQSQNNASLEEDQDTSVSVSNGDAQLPLEDESSEENVPDEEITILPPPVLTDAQKEDVLKIDSAIWDRVLSAEKNYDNLLSAMESANSLYSLYRFCEDLESLMSTYSSSIGEISDKNAEEYIEYAGLYFYQIGDIAAHVRKYADNNNLKELSKAEDGMQNLNSFTEAVVVARFSYLSVSGFSDEEIIEIGENSVE